MFSIFFSLFFHFDDFYWPVYNFNCPFFVWSAVNPPGNLYPSRYCYSEYYIHQFLVSHLVFFFKASNYFSKFSISSLTLCFSKDFFFFYHIYYSYLKILFDRSYIFIIYMFVFYDRWFPLTVSCPVYLHIFLLFFIEHWTLHLKTVCVFYLLLFSHKEYHFLPLILGS